MSSFHNVIMRNSNVFLFESTDMIFSRLNKQCVAMAFVAAFFVAKAQAIAITDVTFVIPPEYFATQAQLVDPGNDNANNIGNLTGFGGDPWSLLDKTDDVGDTFNGVRFTFSDVYEVSGDNYTWTLNWINDPEPPAPGEGLPLYTDFVFVAKASDAYAAYLFEDVYFPAEDLSGGGTFKITFTNNGGQIPNLSHASAYARLTTAPIDPEPNPAPVPGTLLLLGAGLLGVARFRRKS